VRGPTAHSRQRKRSPRPCSGSQSVPQLTAIGVDDAPDRANAKQQLATVGIDHPTAIANAEHQFAGVGIDHPRATDPKENLSSDRIDYAVPVIAFIAHDLSLEKTRSHQLRASPSTGHNAPYRARTRALNGEIVGGVLDFGID
jgi:hypothetical protein